MIHGLHSREGLYRDERRRALRAIDFHEGAEVDEAALKALIRAAVALHASRAKN